MLKLQTVICAVDFSELSKRELQLAVEVCQAFGARLLVHHNMAGAAPGFAREWEWKGVHRGGLSMAQVQEQLQALLAEVSKGIRAEATVTAGPVVPVMLQVVEQVGADLVIVGSHGWSTEDHASVAERLIERCSCPVLTLQEAKVQGRAACMPYLTLGYPQAQTSLDIICAIADAGADLIELGIPFSDPLADGPTIQRSTQVALENGISVQRCLELVADFRRLGLHQALILMSYINPLLASSDRLLALDARVVVYEKDMDESILPKLAIRAYPAQYTWRVTTRSGLKLTIRPIRAEDEPNLVKFQETLSERTVYLRYLQALKLSQRVAHERLVRICFNDYDREMALVAEQKGAGEFFCGYVPPEWLERYGGAFWLNRRGPVAGNLLRRDDLSLLAERSRARGIPVFVTLNAPYYKPEQQVGGYDDQRPWVACMTLSSRNQWAWGGPTDGVKSLDACLTMLLGCAGGDGNMLLNVGPMPTGEIPPDQADRLKEIGAWLTKYRESIYGTRGGPFKPGNYGVSTRKGKTIYLHIRDWDEGTVTFPALAPKVVGGVSRAKRESSDVE